MCCFVTMALSECFKVEPLVSCLNIFKSRTPKETKIWAWSPNEFLGEIKWHGYVQFIGRITVLELSKCKLSAVAFGVSWGSIKLYYKEITFIWWHCSSAEIAHFENINMEINKATMLWCNLNSKKKKKIQKYKGTGWTATQLGTSQRPCCYWNINTASTWNSTMSLTCILNIRQNKGLFLAPLLRCCHVNK